MELMHNKIIKVISGPLGGIYRIILAERSYDAIVLANIDSETPSEDNLKSGTSKSHKKRIKLIWFRFDEITALQEQGLLLEVDLHSSKAQFVPLRSDSIKKQHTNRIIAMQGFLNFDNFRHRLLTDGDTGRLIEDALATDKFSKPYLYQLFYLLCRYGFSENSLKPEYHNSGAPGVLRPYGPYKKKAGKRATKEKLALLNGEKNIPIQPGVSEEWRKRIITADKSLPLPKPKMTTRIRKILDIAFVKDYIFEGNKVVPIGLEQGQYPTHGQVKWALRNAYSEVDRYIHKTTKHHFLTNKRGLTGKNWEGVSGPGHTYAIDSTVGDIYLRSALRRDWVVGRPIVYVIVDVWSTAIVGFYACLQGPSWDMAKIAIFCTVANQQLINELRGSNLESALYPQPTLPAIVLGDRGEYLQKNASITGAILKVDLAYAPPYRGDIKGVNEVIHRIGKDEQYMFVPGAFDARRKEYELRNFKYDTALFTVAEYTRYLQSVFEEYNATADRSHRLEAHMKAAGVHPSPAGLWNWGHQMGIGFQRHTSDSELISNLLPQSCGRMTRNGLLANRLTYLNKTLEETEAATVARNSGNWDVLFNHYPGYIGKIWTPNRLNKDMVEIELSDYSGAAKNLTLDELEDAHAEFLAQKFARDHQNMLRSLGAMKQRKDMVQDAQNNFRDTNYIPASYTPSATEARHIENQFNNLEINTEHKDSKNFIPSTDPYSESHNNLLEEMFKKMERNEYA